MMTTVVVDASAIAALLFGEPEAPAILAALTGCNLVAPRLLRYEIASTALKKQRLYPDKAAAIAAAVQRFPALAIREADIDAGDILVVAGETGLSSYDASYLVLARRLRVGLVTLDRQLQAATNKGVTAP